MFIKKYKTLISLILASMLLAPVSTYCMDNPPVEVEQEVEGLEENPEETRDDESENLDEPLPEKDYEETGEKVGNGDEDGVITSTTKSEENNSQVNLSAVISQDFGLDIYVDFENEETGNTYRLYGLSKNNYSAYIFVPQGHYRIIDCAVWGDTTNAYPLNLPTDFVLSESDYYTIETSLLHEKEIDEEIAERLNNEFVQVGDEEEDTLEIKEFEEDEPLPWRVLEKSEGLEANVTVKGQSQGKYDVIIKIVKEGEVNEAEFIYSLDNGETWSNNQLLQRTFSPDKTGLIFDFPNKDESGRSETWKAVYKVGDTVTFHSFPEYTVQSKAVKNAIINAYKSDEIYTDAQVVIKIVETGATDTATFTYSFDNGATFKDVALPMNEAYQFEEMPLVIQFTDLSGEYVVNDTFSFEIKGAKIQKDKTYMLYILIGIAGAIVIGFYFWLISLKEKDSDFRLNEYTPYNELHPTKGRRNKKK